VETSIASRTEALITQYPSGAVTGVISAYQKMDVAERKAFRESLTSILDPVGV